MPDKQILEAMIERQLNDVTEQKDGFTPLEQELRKIVAQHIRQLPSWETQLRMLKDVKSCADLYLALLNACAEETPRKEKDNSFEYTNCVQKQHGYNVAENGLNYVDAIIKQRLQDLERAGFVDSKRFSYVIHNFPQIYEHGEFIAYPEQKHSEKYYKSFIATERGIKLLGEHRKMKVDKGE